MIKKKGLENELQRNDKQFNKEIVDISRHRFGKNLDKSKKPLSIRRITKGLINLPSWELTKEELKKANFLEEKRGSIMDLFVIIIVAFVMVFFMVAGTYLWNQVTQTLVNQEIIITQTPTFNGTNISLAAEQTFGQINTSLPQLEWISVLMIFGMVGAILLSNFLVRANPVFFVAYIFVVILAIIFSVYITNAYEVLINTAPLVNTFDNFGAANYFLLNLPIMITIIGFAGAIFLFMGINRDEGLGGGLV